MEYRFSKKLNVKILLNPDHLKKKKYFFKIIIIKDVLY